MISLHDKASSLVKQGFPIPLLIAAAVICIYCYEPLSKLLQYDRQGVIGNQYWRLLTGHFTHWTGEHLFWDAALFSILGILCYRHRAVSFWLLILISPLLISALLWYRLPGMAYYRGLSGVDMALFSYITLSTLRESFRMRDRVQAVFGIIMITAMVLKCIIEFSTGTMLFFSSDTFVPVPMAHLAGMAGGVGIWTADIIREDE